MTIESVHDFSQRAVRGNKRSSKPRYIIFLDTETKYDEDNNKQSHKMDIAWSYLHDSRNDNSIVETRFNFHDNAHNLCRWIESTAHSKSTIFIITHNAFFDLQVIGFFPFFTKQGWQLTFYYDKALTYILIMEKDNRKIKVLSSTNYFDFSLDELGKMVGIKKLDVTFGESSRSELISYCKNDVRILVTAMLKYLDFIAEHDCGRFAMTKSGQAYNAYRHAYMHTPIHIHTDEHVISLERSAYYGGRTEAHFIGEVENGPFVSLDINSMYPYVMRNYKYPFRLIDYRTTCNIAELQSILDGYAVVAHVDIGTEEPAYPKRIDGRLCFPVGRFTTYLSTSSLIYAITKGHIINVHEISVYEQEYIFRDFVDYFYPLKAKYKQQSNRVFERLVKLMLNSLYGKFGQQRVVTNMIPYDGGEPYYRIETYDLVTGEHIMETKLLNTVIQQYGVEETDKSAVAIPGHITDNARLLLWSIIRGIGYDNVLYCDTDSVKIRSVDSGLCTYPIDDTAIGALSKEKEFDRFIIYGAKDYVQDAEAKTKGVPKHAVTENGVDYTFPIFYGQPYHLRKKIDDRFIIGSMTKSLKRHYTKGIVTDSGAVLPFRLNEL